MTLPAGARLGPYEIRSPLGAGGMGEVYRAHDTRLGRDVAVKVIASEGQAPPAQMERFRLEARAVAALDHPHILALHDLGSENGTLFAVFELLEGQTLRQRLQVGPLTVRKSLELALQMCRGLHAAHARGIVHRDLKPDNVFLTQEGHVKILDFGLAELRELENVPTLPGGGTATPTTALFPSGTVGYMSPEQLRGEKASSAADLFALGVVCFEMISGKRPFEGATIAESLAAVLTRDPPDLKAAVGSLPPTLEPLVRRCLEKDPKDRFQSAHDLAFSLEAVLSGTAVTEPPRTPVARKTSPRPWRTPVALLAVALAGLALGLLWRGPDAPPPVFTQLTFRRGWANFGRFGPDGRSVVYTAAWDGGAPEIYATRTDDRVSRPLGLQHAALLSVSPQGQLAILLDPHRQMGIFSRGTLATVPMGGGAPHEVLPDVNEADWAPDGRGLAVLRHAGGQQQIELPLGETIYRSRRGLRLLRVSPDGTRLAFIEGTESELELVAVEIATRGRSVLAQHLPANLFGLAWSPSSREVWLTVGDSTAARDVMAIGLGGRRRLVYRSLTAASLLDVAPDGRALLLRGSDRWGTMSRARGEAAEQDLSIFDFTVPSAVSSDGRTVLLDEFGQAAGPGGAVFVRRAGSPAVRLADGLGLDLTRDGSAALVKAGQPSQLLDVPTGPALPRKLALGTVSPRWARWVPPNGERIVILGQEADRVPRLFVVDRAGSHVRPFGPENGVTFFALSPDGSSVAVRSTPGAVSLVPIDGGAAREITGVADDLAVGSFSGDGKSLFLVRTSVGFPCEVHRLDLGRGQTTLFKRVAPADPTGISQCSWMNLSPDGESYAYGFYRSYADLMLAEGLR